MRAFSKSLLVALVGYGSYTAAWACKCDPDEAPGADDLEVVGVLGQGTALGGGCASMPTATEHGLDVTEVRQDPDGAVQPGDTVTVQLDQGSSCSVDYVQGDTIRAHGVLDASGVLSVQLCNSDLQAP